MIPGMKNNYPESEVIDIENWKNPDESSFNPLVHVMSAMRKCVDLGCREMREGWWDEKIDKYGNIAKKYNEDTRKCFIEAVETLIMFTECNFDDEVKQKVTKLKRIIQSRRKFWLEEQSRWWNKMGLQQQQQLTAQGKGVVEGLFNTKLDFDNYFQQDELKIYRRICTEIINLINRAEAYQTNVEYEV